MLAAGCGGELEAAGDGKSGRAAAHAGTLTFHLPCASASSQSPQDAVVGGDKALEKELAASLRVISKLESDINVSRAQTDVVKLSMCTLEKQLENMTERYISVLFFFLRACS